MAAIISINDNNLLIQKRDAVSASQGYAWLASDDIVFDFDDERTAISNCRLQPQQIQNRYWQQCAQTSIAVNKSGIRHSADLVWQHLNAMRENHQLEQVVFVVPSHYQQENLQLLLGIANSSGLQSQGLVNKAVLMAQHKAQKEGQYLHIDLQLHQTVCSLVEVDGRVAKLKDVDTLNDVSIQLIQDALLKAMQHSFIQSDRFDPLHYAETEQQLFDQLSAAAKSIALEGKATLAVKHNTRLHSITMDSTQWNAVIQPFADRILSAGKSNPASRLLLQLNKLFDGIVPAPFNKKGVIAIDDALLIKSDLVDADNFNDDGFVYRLELPLISREQVASPPSAPSKRATHTAGAAGAMETANSSMAVTHLMQAGLAVPLQKAHIAIEQGQLRLLDSSAPNLESLLAKQQLFILNDPERMSLRLNDRLGSHHADGVITAIQVLA